MDRFHLKRTVSKKISRKRLGSLKAKFKKFLADRQSKPESTSSTSFDSEERDEANSTPGRLLEEMLFSQTSNSSADSEDESLSPSEKKSDSSSDSSSAKKRKSGPELNESSNSSKGKKKKTGQLKKPEFLPDFSGEKGNMDMASPKKSDSSSDSSSSGKKKTKGKQVKGESVKKEGKKKHSSRKKIRKQLNRFLQEEKGKGEEYLLPAFEETPPSSPQSFSQASSGAQSEVVDQLPRYHSLPASPANLAHNVNLYYRRGDSSPVALVHSISAKESDLLPHRSQGSEISLTSPASPSSLEHEWHGVLQDRKSASPIKGTQSTLKPSNRYHDGEGVWKCSRCGWTYTTPYPSIRIRREHRRHCEEFGKANQLREIEKHGAEDDRAGSSGDEELPEASILQKNLSAVQEHSMARSNKDDDQERDKSELDNIPEGSSSSTHGDAEVGGSSDDHVEGAGSDDRRSEDNNVDEITQNVPESSDGTSKTSSSSSDVELVEGDLKEADNGSAKDIDSGRDAVEENSKEMDNRQSEFISRSGEEETQNEAQDQTPPLDKQGENFRQLKFAAVSKSPEGGAEESEPHHVDDTESTKDVNHGAKIGHEDSILSVGGDEAGSNTPVVAAVVDNSPEEEPEGHQLVNTDDTESSMEDVKQDSKSIASEDEAGRTSLDVAAASDDGRSEEEREEEQDEEVEGYELIHVHDTENSIEDDEQPAAELGSVDSDSSAAANQVEKTNSNGKVVADAEPDQGAVSQSSLSPSHSRDEGGQHYDRNILNASSDTDFENKELENLESSGQSATSQAAVGAADNIGLGKGSENFKDSEYHSERAGSAEDELDKAEASPSKGESTDAGEDSKEIEPHRDVVHTPDEEENHPDNDGSRAQEDISGDDAGSRSEPIIVVTPVALHTTRELESEIGTSDTMTFSSVQKYWADVTKSEYLLIEGKRSPSMRVHGDPGQGSLSLLSLNNAEIGSDRPSSSRESNTQGAGSEVGDNGEITSHSHGGHHEESTSSNSHEGYDFPQIVREQRTHDLICPVCGSCVTKRIILRKRKRTLVLERPDNRPKQRRPEEPGPPAVEPDDDTETWGCLACLSFFIRIVRGEPKPQEPEAAGPQPVSEEEPDRVECLPLLFPPFNWGAGKADSDLVEPFLPEPDSEESPEPQPDIGDQQAVIRDDWGRLKIFRYLNFARTPKVLDSTDAGKGKQVGEGEQAVQEVPKEMQVTGLGQPGDTGEELVEEVSKEKQVAVPGQPGDTEPQPIPDAQLYRLLNRVPELLSSLSWGGSFPKYDISPALLKKIKEQQRPPVKPKPTIPFEQDQKGKGIIDDNEMVVPEEENVGTWTGAGTSSDVPTHVDGDQHTEMENVKENMVVEPSDKDLCFCLPMPTIKWSREWTAKPAVDTGLSKPLLPEDDGQAAVIPDSSTGPLVIEGQPGEDLAKGPAGITDVSGGTVEKIIHRDLHFEGTLTSEITKATLESATGEAYPDSVHVDRARYNIGADIKDGKVTNVQSVQRKPLESFVSTGFGQIELPEENGEASEVTDDLVAKGHEDQIAKQIVEAVTQAKAPGRWWWSSSRGPVISDSLEAPLLGEAPGTGGSVAVPIETPRERCSCLPSLPAFSLYDCFQDDHVSPADIVTPDGARRPPDVKVTVEDGDTTVIAQGSRDQVEETAELAAAIARDSEQVGARPSTEKKPYEFLKSIVHGGLDVSLVSLGVVSSGAGGDAKTITVLAIGLANLFFGIITYYSAVTSLYYNNRKQFEKEIGNRFWMNGFLAVFSFIFFGALAPITYGFSFQHTTNRDFKFVAACGITLVVVVLLGSARAYLKSKSPVKVVLKLITTGALAAVVGYEAGDYVSWFLEKVGFDSV